MKLTNDGISYNSGDLDKFKAVIESDLSMPQRGFILNNLSGREVMWFRNHINKREYKEVSNPYDTVIVFKRRKKAAV